MEEWGGTGEKGKFSFKSTDPNKEPHLCWEGAVLSQGLLSEVGGGYAESPGFPFRLGPR